MEYLVVSFRSRAHTVKFYDILKRNGVYAEIINTPKAAGVGCGLSVKTSTSSFAAVKNLLRAVGLSSFSGFFLVSMVGGKSVVRSI